MKAKKYNDTINIRVKDKDEKHLYENAIMEIYNLSISEYIRGKLDEVLAVYSKKA